MERQLRLNPNARPFVPLAPYFAEVEHGDEHNHPAENNFHGGKLDVSDDNKDVTDILNSQKVLVSDVSSTKLNVDNGTFPDEISLIEKLSIEDEVDASEPNSILKFLSDFFPDVSIEYLTAILNASDGDLDTTMEVMLSQECGDDIPEALGTPKKG
ncbi:hypothetical protein HPP92_004414 [Vanilla planifolia]|uniref:CUE domain-containing protein n=1 Tax=Vanilla planifolia TaxID=51239 RepID=A0A835VDY4_VANPL|nr:hypothetical protein HPP92_004414 [Vanilla planifolia]